MSHPAKVAQLGTGWKPVLRRSRNKPCSTGFQPVPSDIAEELPSDRDSSALVDAIELSSRHLHSSQLAILFFSLDRLALVMLLLAPGHT